QIAIGFIFQSATATDFVDVAHKGIALAALQADRLVVLHKCRLRFFENPVWLNPASLHRHQWRIQNSLKLLSVAFLV
ncbi:MAG: hypothetical protein LUP91_17260, partial [Methylococcaceae bacterium]|nr:hypothetical protein [Methylococcaceae bacterium]